MRLLRDVVDGADWKFRADRIDGFDRKFGNETLELRGSGVFVFLWAEYEEEGGKTSGLPVKTAGTP